MFKSKNFWLGFFGFLGALFLFYTYDIALFDYKSKKIVIADALEQKLRIAPNTVTFSLNEDCPLSTLIKGKVQKYKSIKKLIEGKNTILLVWSPTCTLCPDQLQKLNAFKKNHKKINVLIIGTAGDIKEAYKKYQKYCKDDFIYDNDTSLKLLRVLAADLIQAQDIGFPFYAFINKKGQVIARTSGSIPWDQVGDDIAHAKF